MRTKIVYASVLVCWFLATGMTWTASAQVEPLGHGPSPTGSVAPQNVPPVPGSVSPLPFDEPHMDQVMAEGRANIHDGNVEVARNAALRMAYAEAVSRVVGVEIGTLTVIRNVHRVSDVVMSRSRGFIKQYEIIREGLTANNPNVYEVVIRAQVLTRGVSDQDEADGLRLYLEILNNPTLLILLPERGLPTIGAEAQESTQTKGVEVRSGDTHVRIMEAERSSSGTVVGDHPGLESPDLILRGGEAAMAQAFSRYGYRVMTSDELLADGLIGPETVASARRGVTRDALIAARAAGADLALVGGMRFTESMVQPVGIPLVLVSAEVSAKAVVTSSGRNLAVFHQSYRASATDRLSAYVQALNNASEGIAQVLAWKIPQILSQEVRETRLVIHGADYDAAEKIRKALENNAQIDAARISRLPTPQNQSIELTIMSSFLGLEPSLIIAVSRDSLTRDVQVVSGDRFHIELKTL